MDQRQIMQRLQAGLAHHQAGRADEAEKLYREVLAAEADCPDALHLLGVLQAQRGIADEGLALLRRAVTVAPQVGDFQRHLGEVLHALGQNADALQSFTRALQINPNDVVARAGAGAALLAMGHTAQAAEQLRIVAQQRPNDAAAVGNYGHVLGRLGRTGEALTTLKRALDIDANCGSAWMQYAEAIWRGGRYEDAVPPARRAAELQPNDARAQVMLGNTLQTAGAMEEAERVYRRAIELDSNSFDAHSNLALTLLKQGEAQAALKLYDEIVARWPHMNDARANRSLALLTLGDFERGFAEYEARWQSPHFAGQRGAGVMWDGGDVRGKTVLLTSEQGHGDTIHFVRYATLLAERGANVIVSCQQSLAALVRSVRGVSRVVVARQESVSFDVYAPLASLPRLMKTTLATVPADVPYLRADETLVAKWRQRFAGDANVKVGIAWAGSPQHQNDRVRSARFEHFRRLLEVPGVTLYSLQKGDAAAQVTGEVVRLDDELTDYSETAAALVSLDLIISVDTSIVHLAGALARPVWTLLARGPDWRWMLGRDDSPWYPTMKLFRQEKMHDWDEVTERVRAELSIFVEEHHGVGRR